MHLGLQTPFFLLKRKLVEWELFVGFSGHHDVDEGFSVQVVIHETLLVDLRVGQNVVEHHLSVGYIFINISLFGLRELLLTNKLNNVSKGFPVKLVLKRREVFTWVVVHGKLFDEARDMAGNKVADTFEQEKVCNSTSREDHY